MDLAVQELAELPSLTLLALKMMNLMVQQSIVQRRNDILRNLFQGLGM